MENITSVAELKKAIQLLEEEQYANGQMLKEQFYVVIESFKPVNILKRIWNNISESSTSKDNLLGTVVGLMGGYLSNKIVAGKSAGIIRKLIGLVTQVGVTNFATKRPEMIKSFFQFILQQFSPNAATNSKSRVG
jgi:hypothetical protein